MSAVAESRTIEARVQDLDWPLASTGLDACGWGMLSGLLTARESALVSALYTDNRPFRSHVIMAQHGFGRGEYKYFLLPLAGHCRCLTHNDVPPSRAHCESLDPITGFDVRYPGSHALFIERCHQADQVRPTPLLLHCGSVDFNALHQDLYGEHAFPLQVAILLSNPDTDFTGGEFVLTEQRPRMHHAPK